MSVINCAIFFKIKPVVYIFLVKYLESIFMEGLGMTEIPHLILDCLLSGRLGTWSRLSTYSCVFNTNSIQLIKTNKDCSRDTS
jgi:hypothetical protein